MSHRLVLPQTNAPVCPGLAEPSGGFARGRASTPIRTWSARAIAPPPGSPGAATDADQPHRQRVRQTSLPRHSGCRSTERPFRCVVVDHTVRPSQAVPSREGTPVRHDQHQRPARNPPSVDRPLLPAEPSTYAVSSGVSFRCRQGVSFECRLTRGDGPAHGTRQDRDPAASPHTRGWTRGRVQRGHEEAGFPAHAGMDPGYSTGCHGSCGLPRTRGDGPAAHHRRHVGTEASPHTRGWTLGLQGLQLGVDGFPAHAGMDPWRAASAPRTWRLPRTRGDGPSAGQRIEIEVQASPHTRGWTPERGGAAVAVRGFPAHAGMDPSPDNTPSPPVGLPRTRGDGPSSRCVGVMSSMASPHTRGWTWSGWRKSEAGQASPHTRGWTPGGGGRHVLGGGFPAHAGMDVRRRTGRRRRLGFPAHAGMDRRRLCAVRPRRRLPRTRGDGPEAYHARDVSLPASPHTRGWTRARSARHVRRAGFPAHAGMDPGVRRDVGRRGGLPRTRGDGPLRG